MRRVGEAVGRECELGKHIPVVVGGGGCLGGVGVGLVCVLVLRNRVQEIWDEAAGVDHRETFHVVVVRAS